MNIAHASFLEPFTNAMFYPNTVARSTYSCEIGQSKIAIKTENYGEYSISLLLQ